MEDNVENFKGKRETMRILYRLGLLILILAGLSGYLIWLSSSKKSVAEYSKEELLAGLTPLKLIGSREPISLRVEMAKDFQSRQQGLMGREVVATNSGMLFIFDDEQIRSFWMKNVLIPLDILFFNADKKLMGFNSMDLCEKDSCEIYSSKLPAQYALEVYNGFINDYGLKGDEELFLEF